MENTYFIEDQVTKTTLIYGVLFNDALTYLQNINDPKVRAVAIKDSHKKEVFYIDGQFVEKWY